MQSRGMDAQYEMNMHLETVRNPPRVRGEATLTLGHTYTPDQPPWQPIYYIQFDKVS